MSDKRPPLPPFTAESARQKVRMAEDAWNSRDPDRVVLVYTLDTRWHGGPEPADITLATFGCAIPGA